MSKPDDAVLHEILQRVIRTETRIVQLGDHVGANLREKQRIEVEPTRDGVVVYIDALDVSLSRIATEIRQSEHWARLHLDPNYPKSVPIRLGTRTGYENVAIVNIIP